MRRIHPADFPSSGSFSKRNEEPERANSLSLKHLHQWRLAMLSSWLDLYQDPGRLEASRRGEGHKTEAGGIAATRFDA